MARFKPHEVRHDPEYDSKNLIAVYQLDMNTNVWGFLYYQCKYCSQKMKYHQTINNHIKGCREYNKTYVYPKDEELHDIITNDRKIWVRKFPI